MSKVCRMAGQRNVIQIFVHENEVATFRLISLFQNHFHYLLHSRIIISAIILDFEMASISEPNPNFTELRNTEFHVFKSVEWANKLALQIFNLHMSMMIEQSWSPRAQSKYYPRSIVRSTPASTWFLLNSQFLIWWYPLFPSQKDILPGKCVGVDRVTGQLWLHHPSFKLILTNSTVSIVIWLWFCEHRVPEPSQTTCRTGGLYKGLLDRNKQFQNTLLWPSYSGTPLNVISGTHLRSSGLLWQYLVFAW